MLIYDPMQYTPIEDRDAGHETVPLTSIGSLQTISGTCLTLFSKFFSPFLHSTCSLSVNRQYLALDGVYHPIWSAIPSKSTLWQRIRCPTLKSPNTGFSPSLILRSKQNYTQGRSDYASIDYNSALTRRLSSCTLPASVALTEGILVSFFSSG